MHSWCPAFSGTVEVDILGMIKSILNFLIARPVQFLVSLPWVRYSLIGGIYQNFYSPREKMLDVAMKYAAVSKLGGDYFEFGVHAGKTFIAAFHASRRYFSAKIHFYAFDSFEGLPEPNTPRNEFEAFTKGQWTCSKETFKKNLKKKRVDLSRVHIVAGWYRDTLNDRTRAEFPAKKAAVIYVDCDLYESAVEVLNFIVPYLEHGTLLLFDDWFAYRGDPNRGEQRAFREWLVWNPEISVVEYHKFGWSGNSFIVHLKTGTHNP
ncbi:MAG: hypothetical protein A3C07_02795 [Candidatus Sungbacteria bacterium RIFCSPHIGHO2_02_FULL_47_11]|uniref:Methyltransferase n=1 Tax=Candidatus Sungbacteria bacterium RIFCSPHIGHO2_02_FULL_47_11 TaxID=1802270 RepID=A0A1G2KKH5_9BACT|nr:MAG: hypothetical protein A3C07_02795 [Candidatus Sungbacteria bacterium RIFCSPHIGHO2_02_FULL_47_11]